jgi:hypothetical protein
MVLKERRDFHCEIQQKQKNSFFPFSFLLFISFYYKNKASEKGKWKVFTAPWLNCPCGHAVLENYSLNVICDKFNLT